jgi:hypothetical protein
VLVDRRHATRVNSEAAACWESYGKAVTAALEPIVLVDIIVLVDEAVEVELHELEHAKLEMMVGFGRRPPGEYRMIYSVMSDDLFMNISSRLTGIAVHAGMVRFQPPVLTSHVMPDEQVVKSLDNRHCCIKRRSATENI